MFHSSIDYFDWLRPATIVASYFLDSGEGHGLVLGELVGIYEFLKHLHVRGAKPDLCVKFYYFLFFILVFSDWPLKLFNDQKFLPEQ